MAKSLDVVQGTLDLLILKALSVESFHGWGISARIQELSGDVFHIGQGSLYPALHRLERQGYVDAVWGLSDNNRNAKFYHLSAAGRRRLRAGSSSWHAFVDAAGRALRATSPVPA